MSYTCPEWYFHDLEQPPPRENELGEWTQNNPLCAPKYPPRLRRINMWYVVETGVYAAAVVPVLGIIAAEIYILCLNAHQV